MDAARRPAPAGTPRTASGAPLPGQMSSQPRRLTPEQIRTTTFGRSALGRRGYSEDEVHHFNHRLAEELASRDAELVRLIDENHRLKQAMRDWQSERIGQPEVEVADRVSAETAALMARAQQAIDAQLAQTELYCRQREQEAVRRYDEIVRHARQQVKVEAEQAAHRYRAASGAGYDPDQERLQRQDVYIGALLQALDALGAHVQATRQAFAAEIGKLGDTPTPGDPTATATAPGAAEPVMPVSGRVD
jgi:DivIVA domain-containing protein